MNKIYYNAHLLLHSRIKIFLSIIICISYSFLHNDLSHISLCEEVKNNNETNQTILGMSLFVGSIILVFLLQQVHFSIDPSGLGEIINSTVETTSANLNSPNVSEVASPIITELPSCLDDFQINDVGDVIINGIRVDLDNIYLNASKVEEEIINNILKNQVADYKAFHLVTALSRAEALDPVYLSLYEDFLEKGNRPEDFYNFLAKALKLNR